MGLIKQPNGRYQARIKGTDGKIVSEIFPSRRLAELKLGEWKVEKRDNVLGSNLERNISVAEFFEEWWSDISSESSKQVQSGWRDIQKQYFRDYIDPEIGKYKLRTVTPQMVKRVFIEMAKADKAPQTQRLVYSTLKKMFGDAVENYQYLTFNPVLKKLRPVVPVEEALHLNINQIKTLLTYVENRKYGLAIWIQIYLGLRVGELIALRWEDVDLDEGRIHIRRTFVKKNGFFRDYPKGGKQHSHSVPKELLEKLREAKKCATSEFIVASPKGNHLPYRWYLATLKGYCNEIQVPVIATHGLRHSTSELYIHHGATRDDLRSLFAHSTLAVTDRYVHNRGTTLEKVANVIQLFPVGSSTSQNEVTRK